MAVRELTPQQALDQQRAGAVLLDIREAHERALGMASGASGVARAELESDPGAYLPDASTPVMLICQRGLRSRACADALAARGHGGIASVAGGTDAWQAAGLPMADSGLDADFAERYSRHLRLPEVGVDGQRRLGRARVLVVGAGGLGSPAALYLAAAGVGTLRLADDDAVDRSNLQRQVLHAESRIGMDKVRSAGIALRALNPRTAVEEIADRVASANVERLLDGVDVVVDGADNFPARYLLNDACVKLGIPLVYGAVERFQGQASVFDAGRHRGERPCYRCLFPAPPSPDAAPNCAEAGVLGVLPGLVGLVQATETLKLLLGLGEPLTGRLLQIDALSMRFRETRLAPDPDCAVCAPGRAFPGYIDYAAFCRSASG